MATAPAVLPLTITTSLGPDKFIVNSFRGDEQISGLFHFHVELSSSDSAVDFSSLMGNPATVVISLASGDKQYISGVVSCLVQSGTGDDFTTYFLELRPWLWLLTM